MKLSSISLLALSAAAAAQPRARGRKHPHPVKRQEVAVEVVTDIVTQTQAAAVVFVDQNGNVLSTSFAPGSQPGPTPVPSAPEPPSAPPNGNPQAPPAGSPQSPPAGNPQSPPGPYKSPESPSPHPQQPGGGAGGAPQGALGYGLSYSPYGADGSCKSQQQVQTDFEAFSGYGFIRSYGVDCDQVNTMLSAATAKGMKMIAGIYNIGSVGEETQALIDAAQGKWDSIDTVVIGNEAVSSGMASVDQVVSAVNTARGMLQSAGYNGKVVTVETFVQIIDNPQLCQASDFPAANCHAFFNSDLTADQAGQYVKEQAQRVSQACGGKQTMITESGWPANGDTNGKAVPSRENQRLAIDSLRNAFSDNIVLFSAFNDYWKQNNPATFNAEQFWGIYGDAPS